MAGGKTPLPKAMTDKLLFAMVLSGMVVVFLCGLRIASEEGIFLWPGAAVMAYASYQLVSILGLYLDGKR